jgi:pimeloyl-ACP methyl ester carboxylesterase
MDTLFRSEFVNVNGVRLHYLDWGGTGEVLLLLPGFGDNASIFDGFAQKFTDHFHVIGLTRRGSGESDKPPTGYDTATRVEDIRHFLDALRIEKVSIIGHSMAGDEVTYFASFYPVRVNKLIYLDAAYDRRRTADITLSDPATPPLFRRLFLEVLESPDAAQILVTDMPPLDEWERYKAIIKAMTTFQTDYSTVQAPALAFYALPEHHPYTPPEAAQEIKKSMDEWWVKNGIAYIRACIEQFLREAPHSQVVEMKDANHYMFIGNTQAAVVSRIREFLFNERSA